jgi:hypothetical protein
MRCMKQTTIGVFEERALAEQAIDRVHKELRIPSDDISFLYRNTDGEVKEVKTDALIEKRTSTLSANIFMGGIAGALLGGVAGYVAAQGFAPLHFLRTLTPINQITDLANLSGTIASVAGIAILGVVIGVLAGAIIELVRESTARRVRAYSDQAEPNNIVVAVIAPERTDVISLFRNLGAFDARVYRLSI